jgi:hypothetical protein
LFVPIRIIATLGDRAKSSSPFGTIAVVPQIDGVLRSEVPLPNGLIRSVLAVVEFAEGMRDRIADQHEVVVLSLNRRHLLFVAFARGSRRKVGITRLGCGRDNGAYRWCLGTNHAGLKNLDPPGQYEEGDRNAVTDRMECAGHWKVS